MSTVHITDAGSSKVTTEAEGWVEIHRIEYQGDETNASCKIDGLSAGTVSFIDDKCGGLLVRYIGGEGMGTVNLHRMTRAEATLLRKFLFKFETGV